MRRAVPQTLSRRRLLWLSALAPLVSAERLRADESSMAAELLRREHALVRRGDNVWTVAAEVQLRQRLAELPKLKESIVAAERDLEERIEQNRRAWQEHAPARAALKQALSKLSSGDPQRKILQAQLDALVRTACDPARLAGRGDVRSRLVQLVHDRTTVAISLLWLRAAWPPALKQYEVLIETPAVQQALGTLGNEHRLGPAKSYEQDFRRLGEYERLVFTRSVPIYQQSGQTRVMAIVNERLPLTFTWSEASDQKTVLTAGTFAALGLKIPADAPRDTLRFGKGRSLAVRQMTLEHLRLGRCVVRGVPVQVLPPEGEDLGSCIGPRTIAEHTARLEPERLRLTIDG